MLSKKHICRHCFKPRNRVRFLPMISLDGEKLIPRAVCLSCIIKIFTEWGEIYTSTEDTQQGIDNGDHNWILGQAKAEEM